MRKLLTIFAFLLISSCSAKKYNEELQFYGFNERNKPIIDKEEIYLTKVTRFETFNHSVKIAEDKYENGAKMVGSWDFAQKSAKNIKEDVFEKAVELGSNYTILFEKKNCSFLDVYSETSKRSEETNCYRINYYYIPKEVAEKVQIKSKETKKDLDEQNSGKELGETKELQEKTEKPKDELLIPQLDKS